MPGPSDTTWLRTVRSTTLRKRSSGLPDVHRALGPELLESAYAACLAFELQKRGLKLEQQKPIPLVYEEVKLECGYRADLVVESAIIIEISQLSVSRRSTRLR